MSDLLWRRRDLGTLLVLSGLAAAGLATTARDRTRFDPAAPPDPRRTAGASEKLDPNAARAASLRRLPNLGAVRARAIVAYRRRTGPRAFRSADDLASIRGIGPGTVESIRPYLRFPTPP